jgi:RING finger protein 113A
MADESAKNPSVEKPTCSFFKKSKGRKNVRKRPAGNSDSDDGESPVVLRKEKKVETSNPMIQKSEGFKEKRSDDVKVEFKSTRSAMSAGPTDLGATATYELDTDFDRDAQAVFAKSLEVNKEIKEKEAGDEKLYRGVNNYLQYYEKKDTAFGNAASGMVR